MAIGLRVPDPVVLVTANHVCCDQSEPGATKRLGLDVDPTLIDIRFSWRDPTRVFRGKVLWQSPVNALDVTVLRLDPAPTRASLPYDFCAEHLDVALREPSATPDGHAGRPPKPRICVLHHPNGERLSHSPHDNILQDIKARHGTQSPRFLHYRCATARGSSGGPILNDTLQVIGIHRAGSETAANGFSPVSDPRGQAVNEGVSILSVKAAIERFETDHPLTSRIARWARAQIATRIQS
jgi:hypothetical protein